MCTNGAGLGHMNRCLSYARKLRGRAEPVFFSLASAIEIIEKMGFAADYLVSYNWSRASATEWNRELCLRFGMMLERVAPEVVVFDGTWPYQGFVNACKKFGQAKVVWSHRGLHQAGKEKSFLHPDLFSLIVRPGEIDDQFGFEVVDFDCAQVRVPPVCILDEDDLLDKRRARAALGLRVEARYALFSLGAGNINDVEGVASGIIRQLGASGIDVVWARNPISIKDVELPESVRAISVYPLVRYLRAFDMFVGAAGYNTCCEVVQAQVPALLVPNMKTKLDDQCRRAHLVANYAPVVVSECESEIEREAAVVKLLDLVNSHVDRQCPIVMNGAELAAEEIMHLIDGGCI